MLLIVNNFSLFFQFLLKYLTRNEKKNYGGVYFFSEQNVAKELQQQQRREINAVLEQKTLPISERAQRKHLF